MTFALKKKNFPDLGTWKCLTSRYDRTENSAAGLTLSVSAHLGNIANALAFDRVHLHQTAAAPDS